MVMAATGLLCASCSSSAQSEAAEPELLPYDGTATTTGAENAVTAQSGRSMSEAGEEFPVPSDILATDNIGAPATSFDDYRKAVTDYYIQLSKCMEDKGWPELIIDDPYTPSPSVVLKGVEQDPERYVIDFEACQADGAPFPGPVPLTQETAEKHYEQAFKGYQCLVENGARLPEFPSKQTIIDDFLIRETPWDPRSMEDEHGRKSIDYSTDPLFSKKSLTEIYTMCPW